MGQQLATGKRGRKTVSMRSLRPWTDLVKLHLDVEAMALTEAVFMMTPQIDEAQPSAQAPPAFVGMRR